MKAGAIIQATMILIISGNCWGKEITGVVTRVIDGDTIVVDSESGSAKVRLAEIDAPESKQAHGQVAADYLAGLILNRQVTIQYSNLPQGCAAQEGRADHRNRHARRPEHQLPDDLHRSRLALQEVQQEPHPRLARIHRPRQWPRPLEHPQSSRPVDIPKAVTVLKYPHIHWLSRKWRMPTAHPIHRC
jgi:hypothetical protein